MNPSIHRRAFLATSTLAIPAIAMGSVSSTHSIRLDDSEFDNYMKQANQHLKTLRTPMRTLDEEWQWSDAAFAANQITILLLQCAEIAEQASIPERSKEKYKDNEKDFIRDLRIQLANGATASLELAKSLWSQDRPAAKEHYNALRSSKRIGHEEFTED